MGTLQTLRVGDPGGEVIAFGSHLRLHVTDRLHRARSSVSHTAHKEEKEKREKRKINLESLCVQSLLWALINGL